MANSTIKKIASSKNGAVQIGNILIQYGTVDVTTGSSGSTAFPYRGSKTIAFERAYNSPPSTFANCEDWSTYWTASATSVTNIGLTIELSGNANNTTKSVSWLAIGTV